MTFDQYIGMSYDDDGSDSIAKIDIESHHCNPTGNINGGVLISIADNLSTGAAGRAYHNSCADMKLQMAIDLIC